MGRFPACAFAILAFGCGGGTNGDDVPVYVVAPELRIGALDGPAALGVVIGMEVGADGELYVGEWNEGSVGVFDRAGNPLRRLGTSGSGPGEFTMNPGRLHWTGELLSAGDPQAGRLHLFRRDGSLERTVAGRWPPISDCLRIPRPSQPLADGSILGYAQPLSSRSVQCGAEGLLVRMSAEGPTVDTIARTVIRNATILIPHGTGFTMSIHPVSDQTLWSATSDGTSVVLVDRTVAASAAEATFTVTRVDLGGDSVFSRAYAYPPIALDAARADSISDFVADRLYHDQPDRDRQRAEIDELDYLPAYFPPITRLVTGRDSSIWLRREALEDPVTWDVLDAQGELVKRVATPHGLTVHVVDANYVWGVEKDDLDVSYIVRYRIVVR